MAKIIEPNNQMLEMATMAAINVRNANTNAIKKLKRMVSLTR